MKPTITGFCGLLLRETKGHQTIVGVSRLSGFGRASPLQVWALDEVLLVQGNYRVHFGCTGNQEAKQDFIWGFKAALLATCRGAVQSKTASPTLGTLEPVFLENTLRKRCRCLQHHLIRHNPSQKVKQ